LDTYCKFLEDNFKGNCVLTGYQTMGYFGWEERYIFIRKDKDYENIKKQTGSVTDHYKFIEIEPHDETGVGILTHVERTSDGKRFAIPLHDLSFVDSSNLYNDILEDYTSWMTNYR